MFLLDYLTKPNAILWLAVAFGCFVKNEVSKVRKEDDGISKEEKNQKTFAMRDIVRKMMGEYMVEKNREVDRSENQHKKKHSERLQSIGSEARVVRHLSCLHVTLLYSLKL